MSTRDRSSASIKVVSDVGEVLEITQSELDALVEAKSRELKDRIERKGTLSSAELEALVEERARARLSEQKAERPEPIGPFDRVEVTTEKGEVRTLTRAQFEKMQLDERVRAILRKQIRFFSKGVEIPMRTALKNY